MVVITQRLMVVTVFSELKESLVGINRSSCEKEEVR